MALKQPNIFAVYTKKMMIKVNNIQFANIVVSLKKKFNHFLFLKIYQIHIESIVVFYHSPLLKYNCQLQ